MFTPSFINVVDYLSAIFFAPHATSKLKELNYDTLQIGNVVSNPSTFNGDVLFELPLVDNPNGHFS
jgi:hypothetical protein